MLLTVVAFSRTLARLAIGLDKRPDLIAHLTRRMSGFGNDEVGDSVTLVESSANVIREAFTKCLSEQVTIFLEWTLTGNQTEAPENKKGYIRQRTFA